MIVNALVFDIDSFTVRGYIPNSSLFILLQYYKKAWVILVLISMGCQSHESRLLSYDEFLSSLELIAPLEMLDDSNFPIQQECTKLPDSPPYTKTIESALAYIEKNIDTTLFEEAMGFLKSGIVFKPIATAEQFPYSAYFNKRTIFLFEKLFSYGCVEDVVSTLTHELVHAVQKSRYLQKGIQVGEHSLTGSGLDIVIAELEADAYQFYISRELGLVSEAHVENMLKVNNDRRKKFNMLSKPAVP